MARKIGVMGIGQTTGQPRTYVKKSVAALMIRRNVAEWVISNLVVRLRRELSPLKVPQLPRKRKPITYQHHIEPRIFRISRREMEELERYQHLFG